MLIILSKSPFVGNFDTIIEIARKTAGDGEKVAFLHIQDACIAATISEYCDRLAQHGIKVFALKADCQARGLTEKLNRNARLIDYKQWVKLVMTEHKNIVSWTS